MISVSRRRLFLGVLVAAIATITSISFLSTPKQAGAAAGKPATTKAFQQAANSKSTGGSAVEPRAIPAALAAGRALLGTAAFRQEAGNVARAAGLGSIARDAIGAIFGAAAARTASGSDVLLDGAAQ
ncbi:MAG: hypothetical protein M3417_07450 [Actinomycetota bacterium]|nr:hypothetical protein [Actinomycetota bacterium]